MNLHNLFPIPIGFFDIGRDLTKAELAFIEGQETRSNQGNRTSTNNTILEKLELADLKKFMSDSLQAYFKATVNPKYKVDLQMTQSWLNYTQQGQFHHKHTHPNSFISGVFYAKTNPDDRIYFYRSGWQQIKLPAQEYNPYNSESWWFEAMTGRLILFPSSLEHMVPSVQGSDTRISLSFNTFPMGVIGEELDLTGLGLKVGV
jgi:uncharacterized protein (TIGR02466 family)